MTRDAEGSRKGFYSIRGIDHQGPDMKGAASPDDDRLDQLVAEGKLEEAVAYLQDRVLNATNLDSRDDARIELALLLWSFKSRKKEAIRLLRLVSRRKAGPRSDDAAFLVADTHLVHGDKQLALRSYEQFLVKHPRSPLVLRALQDLRILYRESGATDVLESATRRLIEAIHEFKKRGGSEELWALCEESKMLESDGRLEETVTVLKKLHARVAAITPMPNPWAAHYEERISKIESRLKEGSRARR